MKRSTKVMLVAAAAFTTVGIGFTVSGVAMGATMDSVEILKNVKNHGSWFHWRDVMDNDWDWDLDDDDWDDVSIHHDEDTHYDYSTHHDEGIHHVSGTGAASVSSGNARVYEIAPVEEIKISLKYDELILQECDGDTIKVEVENDSGKYVTVESDEKELEITSTKKKSSRRVILCYPKDASFKEVDLEVDAGTIEVCGTIRADEFSVTVGAGEFTGTGGILARECDVEVGAGEIDLEGIDAEKISGECGLGSMTLGVKGTEKDYNYSLECGIGDISIGSESYSGLGREKNIRNTGASRELDLECGMGEIDVSFEH